jgi:hypothetical protein
MICGLVPRTSAILIVNSRLTLDLIRTFHAHGKSANKGAIVLCER